MKKFKVTGLSVVSFTFEYEVNAKNEDEAIEIAEKLHMNSGWDNMVDSTTVEKEFEAEEI